MIKKHICVWTVILLGVLFILPVLPVFSSDVSDADFYGVIQTTNNSTAATQVITTITGMNTTALMAGGFLNSSANNCAIQSTTSADIPFMPGYANSPWVMYNGAVGANTITNSLFYTKGVTGGKLVWFPGAANGTIPDTMVEPGNNFEWTFTNAFIDTTQLNKVLMGKTGAYSIKTDGATAGKINFVILSASGSNQTSHGTAGSLYTGSYIRMGERFTGLGAVVGISSIDLWLGKSGSPTGTANCTIRNSSTDAVLGILGNVDVSTLGAGAWVTFNTSPVVVNVADFRVCLEYNGGDVANYVIVGGQTPSATAVGQFTRWNGAWGELATHDASWQNLTIAAAITSLTGITTGEYDIVFGLSGGTLSLDVGGTSNTTAYAGSVLDSANVTTLCEGDTVLYVESIEYEQGGAKVDLWDWENNTTFTGDTTGNVLTPSKRDTSSDPDVSSELILFQPVTEPTAPPFAVGEGPDFISGNITATETPNPVSGNGSLKYPGKDFIDAMGAAGDFPEVWLPTFIAVFVLLALSVTASYFLKESGATSLFVKSVVNIVGYGVLVSLNIFDWWMLIFFFIFEQAIWFAAKERRE